MKNDLQTAIETMGFIPSRSQVLALFSLLLCSCADAKPTRKEVAYTPQNLQFGPYSETIYDAMLRPTVIHYPRTKPAPAAPTIQFRIKPSTK